MSRDPFRRFVERFMPWYDPDEEASREAETERIRQRSIALRIRVEGMTCDELRGAYRVAGRRVRRK